MPHRQEFGGRTWASLRKPYAYRKDLAVSAHVTRHAAEPDDPGVPCRGMRLDMIHCPVRDPYGTLHRCPDSMPQ